MPLPGRARGLAGMSLYFADPTGAETIAVFGVRRVAALVAEQLTPVADWWAGTVAGRPGPGAGDGDRHGRVCVAVGLLTLALGVSAGEACALIRARAAATGRTVVDLADDLLGDHARRQGRDRLTVRSDPDPRAAAERPR